MIIQLPNVHRYVVALGILVLCLSPSSVGGKEPTAITLLYFRGSGIENAIHLEWATATELDTVGFMVERSESSAGPFAQVDTIGFIPAEGSPDGLTGAQYEATDDNGLTNGSLYWYRLIELERDGTENRSKLISATAGYFEPTATTVPTSTPVAQSTGSANPAPNSNATPTAPVTQISVGGTLEALTATPISPVREVTISDNELDNREQDSEVDSGSSSGQVSGASSNLNQNGGTPNGYPAPPSPTSLAPENTFQDSGYPVEDGRRRHFPETAYPSAGDPVETGGVSGMNEAPGLDPTLSVIGSNAGSATSEDDPDRTSQEPISTLMLWVGFTSALMIFIAGVIGSAYYYRRQDHA